MILSIMEECHARAIPIPRELAESIPRVIAELGNSSKERVKAAAMKLATAALAHNLRVFEVADKSTRLDAGLPTETTVHHVIAFDKAG